MSTEPNPSQLDPKLEIGKTLELESELVKVDHLDTNLVELLNLLATIHWLLFGVPLVITSGNDGQHTAGSAHYHNRAVDVRTRDADKDAMVVFGAVVMYGCQFFHCGLFDERQDPHGGHFHIERFE